MSYDDFKRKLLPFKVGIEGRNFSGGRERKY